MKILLYSTYFLPVVGGVQTYVSLLADGLSKWKGPGDDDHFEVTVVTETTATNWDDSVFAYRVFRQPGYTKLAELIRGADIVHLAGPSLLPMALAWIHRTPFTIEQHGYQAICPNGLLLNHPEKSACPGHFLSRRLDRCLGCRAAEVGVARGLWSVLLTFPRRWLCNHAATNIAITDHVKRRLNLKRSETIYYGIDTAGGLAKEHAPMDVPEVCYVGRLVSEKGLPCLLRAVRCLKDEDFKLRVKFVGDGPERASLEKMARELGIGDRLTITGDLRGTHLDDATRDSAILVMPSIWEETAGLAAIEHMMRGGVVIATDIGGLSEVVGETGLKFPIGDWRALADCIKRMAGQPATMAALGTAARQRAERFFVKDRMIREHVNVWHSLWGESSAC